VLDALAVHRTLLEHDVPHEVVRLPRPIQTADELPEVLDVPAHECVVVRCYVAVDVTGPMAAAGDPVLHALILPAGTEPCPAVLREVLGATSVRDATPAEINKATDCSARLVTAVGLPTDVPLLVDRVLDTPGTVWMSTGDSGTALALPGSALLAVTGAAVHDLTDGGVQHAGGAEDVVIDLTALGSTSVSPTKPVTTAGAASGVRPAGSGRASGA